MLLDYLKEGNHLADQPRWYNALTHNCTTTIRLHAQHVAAGRPWDWRFLANGGLDELGYAQGQIDRLGDGELARQSLGAHIRVMGRANATPTAKRMPTAPRKGVPLYGGQRGGSRRKSKTVSSYFKTRPRRLALHGHRGVCTPHV